MSVIVFPGQGSQYPAMAMDFNENFEISRQIFQEIEDFSKINIRKIISENENNKLNQTNFTQISIFSTSIVIYKTLLNELGQSIINPQIVIGHSLGEYSALVANETLSIKDATNLIKKRGFLMNTAIEPNTSGMAAVIGKDAKYIEDIILNNNLNIAIANDNSPMQVVVSGLLKDIESAESLFRSFGIKRYIKLNVSAAFHSKHMLKAQELLNNEIDEISFNISKIPIISNFNAKINYELKDIIHALKNQMANKVKWTESIKKLEDTDFSKIIEIGPGKVLSGLINRISDKYDINSIDKVDDLKIIANK